MPFIRCPACQTRYQVTAAAGGKRSKCAHCGQVFKIPDLSQAGSPHATGGRGARDERQRGVDLIELEGITPAASEAGDGGEVADAIPISSTVAYASGPVGAVAETRGAYAAYFRSLAGALAFPARMGDLATFGIVWFLLVIGQVLAPYALCIGAIASAIVAGWYISFQLNVVLGAAADDEDLPTLTLTGGIWEDIVGPCLKMLCTYVLIWVPAAIFLLSSGELQTMAATTGWFRIVMGTAVGGAGWLFSSFALKTQIVAGALLAVGYFVWPMLVLIVAVGGGVLGLFQIDLILRTIVRSFPAYLLTVLVVYVSRGLNVGCAYLVSTVQTGKSGLAAGLPPTAVLGPVLLVADIYCTIIAMRAIGSYYHHFKHKFAWSWG